jgi:diacylglycerol kinase (ATP)
LIARHADDHTIIVGAETIRARTMLVAIANSRQYGNGAIIAPHARIDDGQLDVIIIEDRSLLRALIQAPSVFLGQLDRVGGVTMRQGAEVQITSGTPVVFHVDGEPFVGGAVVAARVRPAALRVRVPAA